MSIEEPPEEEAEYISIEKPPDKKDEGIVVQLRNIFRPEPYQPLLLKLDKEGLSDKELMELRGYLEKEFKKIKTRIVLFSSLSIVLLSVFSWLDRQFNTIKNQLNITFIAEDTGEPLQLLKSRLEILKTVPQIGNFLAIALIIVTTFSAYAACIKMTKDIKRIDRMRGGNFDE